MSNKKENVEFEIVCPECRKEHSIHLTMNIGEATRSLVESTANILNKEYNRQHNEILKAVIEQTLSQASKVFNEYYLDQLNRIITQVKEQILQSKIADEKIELEKKRLEIDAERLKMLKKMAQKIEAKD